MKKRRLFLVLFLLVSLVFLGLGYAKLNNTLNINGSLSAQKNDSNLKVEFVGHKNITRHKDDTEATVFSLSTQASGQTAYITVSEIAIPGDYAEIALVVKNNSVELDSLNAVLGSAFTIELGEGTVDGSNYTITHSATNGSTNPNEFEGEHFLIQVSYAETYNGLDAATGTLNDDGTATLNVGKTMIVVVRITLIDIVSDTFNPHVVKVSFGASTN